MANEDDNRYYTYFLSRCALCHQPVDVEDVKSFLAVSLHDGPSSAKWTELDGARFLCIGHAAATNINRSDSLPGVYLVHPHCNQIMPPASGCRRSLFDCIRAIGPVLHEAPISRDWSWTKSSTVFAPALRSVISRTAQFDAIQGKVKLRLQRYGYVRDRLPAELVDMVLQWLPLELALVLDCLSEKKITSSSIRLLRCDPVASRLERASHVLRHKKTQGRDRQVNMAQQMVAQFVKIGGQWYLQDLYSDTRQVGSRQKQIVFRHDRDREPYVGIQVNEFGITHIAFEVNAGRPKWIGPSAINKRNECFQDRSSARGYDAVFVVSDGMKLTTVDIQQNTCSRARAILPLEFSACHWSLSPSISLYVRPVIVDLTKGTVYAWIPRPGNPGLRLSNTPKPGLTVLRFRSSGPKTAVFVSHADSTKSFARFLEEGENYRVRDNYASEHMIGVVALWAYGFDCNFI